MSDVIVINKKNTFIRKACLMETGHIKKSLNTRDKNNAGFIFTIKNKKYKRLKIFTPGFSLR